jgi:sugar transferase (PEP-CTERM/EpsH1 system associated)
MSGTLFLPHRVPFPPDKGDKIRSFHLLKALARRGPVYLGTFGETAAELATGPALREWCADTCLRPLRKPVALARAALGALVGRSLSQGYYHDPVLHRWVRALVASGKVDRIVVFSSSMVPYTFGLPRPVRVVTDLCDVDSDKWAQYAAGRRGFKGLPARLVYAREARTLAALERRTVNHCAATVVISDAEADLLAEVVGCPRAAVAVVRNGVDLAYWNPAEPAVMAQPSPFASDEKALVFTGAMDYWANADAVSWFAAEVLPRVRAVEPAARFWIVGSNPTAAVQQLAAADVSVTGRVPDVRPYLANATVAVAPLRVARGVQNKVLEAMGMARPLVATPAALQGLGAVQAAGLGVGESAAEVAAAVLAALQAGGNAPALRDFVAEEFGWEPQLANFLKLVEGQ